MQALMRIQTSFFRQIASICLLCFSFVVWAAPGLDSSTPVAAYLDGVFPTNSPGSTSGDWIQVDYYPDLSFVQPLRIVEHPTDNKLIIVGKDGKAWSVTKQQGATDKTLFFDISPIMHGRSGDGEGGISDLVFHPEFGNQSSPNSSYVFISYRWAPGKEGVFEVDGIVDGYNRVSRFMVIDGQVDLSTEFVLINQYDRQQAHIAGDMIFGPDGFLYISAGDEGISCDRNASGNRIACDLTVGSQRLDGGLWSGVLRIDVDQDASRSHPIRRQPINLGENPQANGNEWPPSFSQGYYIPNDNPFLDVNGSILEEFYSIGLRHPWTITIDNVTGNLWAADPGYQSREEINLISKGDNHQWPYKEGTIAGLVPTPNPIIGTEVPPIWDYPHTLGAAAVIGAGVYRGTKFPELIGKYLFSDFISGMLWTATLNSNGGYDIEEIGAVTSGFPNGINSYLMDSKGDVLLARTSGTLNPNGKIQMLANSGSVTPAPEPPQWLSQTGAFTDLASLSVHPGCVPYDLNVPFWSDAALKYRWMCVPNDGLHDSAEEQISFSQDDDWVFPKGAVLIKHFEIQTDSSDPASIRRLETRFIVHAEDGYYGVTYRWDEFGIDAQLLTTSEDLDLTIQTPTGPVQQTWHIPSRNECLNCHNTVAGSVLGPKTRQLNRTLFYPATGRVSNQIETLNSLGMLSPGIAANDLDNFLNSVLTSTPTQDTSADISDRARSYLDSNCSYCHRPGLVRANFDARLTTPLAQQGLIYGSLEESLGINGEAVVVPEDTSKSVLYLRLDSAGESISMPPLAKAIVDIQGASVIEQWILSLPPSGGGNTFQPNSNNLLAIEAESFTNQAPNSGRAWQSEATPNA
ncbi:MAG: PQQ-dependent sugar dehydrogenase, partial [bacterium]